MTGWCAICGARTCSLKALRLPGARLWAMPARAILKPRFASVKSPAGVDVRPPQEA